MKQWIEAWSKMISFKLKNPRWYSKGLSPYRRNNWALAQECFEKALAENERHAASWFKLGMCHFRQKRYQEAMRSIVCALEIVASQIQWQDQLYQALRNAIRTLKLSASQKEQMIRDHLDYLVKPSSGIYNQLAHALRKQGKWWQEVEALSAATRMEPKFPSWFFRLGESQEMMGRYQE
ncbi:MAG: tetratricopeptide repeat protein, partial [Salinicola sp.]|uniref:tetratricopeptide repeat protein n=1 Tax=Salinicola sp. TaxID=1978524 RepID=UPI001DF24B53